MQVLICMHKGREGAVTRERGNCRFKLYINLYVKYIFLGRVIVWFVQLNDSEEYLPGQLLIVCVCVRHFMFCYICSQKHSFMLIFKNRCHVCARG